MPEIAEAARIVHFLQKHLVGKQIEKALAIDDSNVFGKAGTTGAAFAASVLGKKVLSAGSQGKYFWLVLDSSPHPVMHFGMTGWIHIKGMRTAYTNYYNKMKPGDADLWPPKFWKFQLEAVGEGSTGKKVELAFTDPRRFGRVRLVDCPGDRIRQFSPLVENGPDPVVDADIFTESFVRDTMQRRHVPIKALLLDQAFISGIGNWVGDEVLFQARLHPEQYCDEFSDAQVKQLYASVCHVCRTAVDLLGDSDRFPDDWLFHYRWGKGSKDAIAQLPTGEKLSFLTVGGRTSCFAPSLQKKSGAVAPGIKEEPAIISGDSGESKVKTKQTKQEKGATAVKQVREQKEKAPAKAASVAASVAAETQKRKRTGPKKEAQEEPEQSEEPHVKEGLPVKKRVKAQTSKPQQSRTKTTQTSPRIEQPSDTGRRRSARLKGNLN